MLYVHMLRLSPLVLVELRRFLAVNHATGNLPSGPRSIGRTEVWTVPAKRMKSNREHRVPLCGRAVEILDGARTLVKGTSPYLFPNRLGKQLEEKQLRRMLGKHKIAAVPHGFRSSFRDWAAEETNHPREVIEAALAHVVQKRVEAAYRRTDLFERRRRLMDDWAAYLTCESREPEAAPIRR